jgi:hypothetical protein
MRRVAVLILALSVVLPGCGDDATPGTVGGPPPSVDVGSAECGRITTEVLGLFDVILDRLDDDPTLMPDDIPEASEAFGQTFELGATCIADAGLALSEIVEYMDAQVGLRPTATGEVIREMIDGMCSVDPQGVFEWTREANAICFE